MADSSMDNYAYVVNWVCRRLPPNRSLRILDYGCGRGLTVEMFRRRNLDCYGCDAFVKVDRAPRDCLLHPEWFGPVIRDMPDGRIPFDSESFDIVVSNQVIEHVENLELTLSELHRVLKPGGVLLSVFPH